MPRSPLLYQLLGSLEKEEFRQLKKYVRSPFVTHREDLALMFNYLADTRYANKTFPDKEALFARTFPDEVYDDQRLRSAMSDLHKIVEQYLRWVAIQADPIGSQLVLAATYRQRNLSKHFQRVIRNVQQVQERQPLRNPEYYQQQLRYQTELMQYQTTNQRTGEFDLQSIDETLDTLYLAQKLRHACTLLSHKAVFQTDYQFGLLRQWIDSLEGSPHLEIPAVALYYYCYRFLTETHSQEYFRQFRATLSQHQDKFPQKELKDLYRAAINFCIRKLNEGSLVYTREGWELFQEGLARGIFLDNGRLSRFTFDNVVGFGLRLKAHQAVAEFITTYPHYLEPSYQASTVAFNFARLAYSRQQYDEALEYLRRSNAKDLVNQLISKTLMLKIYCEANELDLLSSHLDSFRLFIQRREVSDFHRQNFNKIIYYTRKLITLAPYDRQEREQLAQAIEAEQVLTEKSWLLEKLQKLRAC